MMVLNDEMLKLREGLDAAGINWRDESENKYGMHFERTKFANKYGDDCSVIFIEGCSYGWQAGLLESMPPLTRDPDYYDEVQGWLTADEILAEWAQLASANFVPARNVKKL